MSKTTLISKDAHRIGRFFISQSIVEDYPEEVLKVLSQCLVVRCELKFEMLSFEYVALSHLFEESPNWLNAPEYNACFERVDVASEGEEPIWETQFKGFVRS
jgi:hypothetical protein